MATLTKQNTINIKLSLGIISHLFALNQSMSCDTFTIICAKVSYHLISLVQSKKKKKTPKAKKKTLGLQIVKPTCPLPSLCSSCYSEGISMLWFDENYSYLLRQGFLFSVMQVTRTENEGFFLQKGDCGQILNMFLYMNE